MQHRLDLNIWTEILLIRYKEESDKSHYKLDIEMKQNINYLWTIQGDLLSEWIGCDALKTFPSRTFPEFEKCYNWALTMIPNGTSDADSKLDDFQRYKVDLNDKLSILKQDISTKKGIEDRFGTTAESIKLKSKIKKNLDDARRIQNKLDMSHRDAKRDFDNGDSDMTVEEIRSREELAKLMAQDLEFVQHEFEDIGAFKLDHGAFKLLYRRRQKRREKRGSVVSEPQPLTAKQQAFIQESIERDRESMKGMVVCYLDLLRMPSNIKTFEMDFKITININNVEWSGHSTFGYGFYSFTHVFEDEEINNDSFCDREKVEIRMEFEITKVIAWGGKVIEKDMWSQYGILNAL